MKNEILKIVYHTNEVFVLDKPGGVLSVPGRPVGEDSRPILGKILQQELGQQVYPVHRLDFEVSGLILFTTNSETQKILSDGFASRTIQKTYLALSNEQDFSHWPKERSSDLVKTSLEPTNEYNWHSKIFRGKKRSFVSEQGLEAQTLAKFNKLQTDSLLHWHLEPKTGRPHQLRLEMSRRGFPILGDKLYGSKQEFFPNEIALRAVKLDFSLLSKGALAKIGLPTVIEVSEW